MNSLEGGSECTEHPLNLSGHADNALSNEKGADLVLASHSATVSESLCSAVYSSSLQLFAGWGIGEFS